MKKLLLATCILLCSLACFAQNKFDKKTPKLVVNIVADGIQTEHIATLWNYFDEGGIKRIFGNGTVFTNQQFDYYTGGRAADMATFATGTMPASHGVIGNNFFQQKTKEVLSIVSDERYGGISTSEGCSPNNLYASTVGDELKLATRGAAKVYAIALDAEDAIMLGGHAANAAVWVDNEFGKIATSSYYNAGLPAWCNEANIDGTTEHLINFAWDPMFSAFTYNFPAEGKNTKRTPFSHRAADYKTYTEQIKAFKQTPYANKLVRRLALKAIEHERLGKGETSDMLSLFFTLNPPIDSAHELLSAEKEDMYLRFDKELKHLLDSIDQMVGLERTLVVLTGTQSINLHPATLQSQKINSGVFNAGRAMALLNNYLMLLNGQGNWVIGYNARNIYLNERLAERKKVDFRLIEYQTQRFMTEFQGVQSVFITNDLQNAAGGTSETAKVKNSIHPKMSGTVYFTLLPGWIEVDNANRPIGISGRSQITAPIVFFGWQTKTKKIDASISATDIAPTLSQMLRIAKPNACSGQTLHYLFE